MYLKTQKCSRVHSVLLVGPHIHEQIACQRIFGKFYHNIPQFEQFFGSEILDCGKDIEVIKCQTTFNAPGLVSSAIF